MSLGQTDEKALLRGQLAQLQQANANMQALLSQRWAEVAQDFTNGLAILVGNARGGNPQAARQARQALEQLFVNLEAAREASTSKIVLPPGAIQAPPVLIQSGGGEVPDDGAPAEAGNVL